MFLRAKTRKKDGKVHRYWSVVQSWRTPDDRVLQRQVLYLGEINDSQQAAWTRAIEVFGDDGQPQQVAIFPDDRTAPPLDCEVVQIRLSELSLHRPRQWGACWLALALWTQLDLDRFWSPRLPESRQGTRWLNVLKTLVVYRLLDPGSKWLCKTSRSQSFLSAESFEGVRAFDLDEDSMFWATGRPNGACAPPPRPWESWPTPSRLGSPPWRRTPGGGDTGEMRCRGLGGGPSALAGKQMTAMRNCPGLPCRWQALVQPACLDTSGFDPEETSPEKLTGPRSA
jgi:hypothetical protein